MTPPRSMGIFWDASERRLRAPWRIVVQMVMLAALALPPVVGVGEMLSAAHRRGLFLPAADKLVLDKVINMIVGPLLTVLVLASMAIAARLLDRRSFQRFGGPGASAGARWWRDLLFGLLVGGFLQALVFGAEMRLGWIAVEAKLHSASATLPLALGFGFSAVKALCVGTYEEFLSRGYQLVNLTEGLTGFHGLERRGAGLAAALLTSAIFALLHVTNDNSSLLSTVGLFVNGMLLASGVLLTGKLAIPVGMHIGWNFSEGSVFGFPLSGDRESATLLAIQQSGPTAWTGGAFGPEAGLLGIGAMLLGMAAVAGYVRATARRPARSR